VYRGTMAATLPTSVAPTLPTPRSSTLAGAVAVAEQLPGSLGADVLDTARDAFAQSFDVTAVLAAAVLVSASLVTLVLRGDAIASAAPRCTWRPRSLLGSPFSEIRAPKRAAEPCLQAARYGGKRKQLRGGAGRCRILPQSKKYF
jgi:hypothetical protein